MIAIFLHLLDVCHGDCILLTDDITNILIDGGYTEAEGSSPIGEIEKKIFSYLKKHNISHIDYYIISHFHADHFGIAAKILEKFKPSKIFIPFNMKDGKCFVENVDAEDEKTEFGIACKQSFQDFLSSIFENKLENNLAVVENNLKFALKDSLFSIYNPVDTDCSGNIVKNNLNNKSAMFFTLTGSKYNALLFSDTQANANKRAKEILLKLEGEEFQIIKLPHHGDFSPKYFDEEFYYNRRDSIKVLLASCGISRCFNFDSTDFGDLERFAGKHQLHIMSTHKYGDIVIDLSNINQL